MSGSGPSGEATADRRERRIRRTERLVRWVLHLLAPTWRIVFEHADRLPGSSAAPRPYIFAMWHGELLPIIWAHRDRGIVGMVSEHGDGEILARITGRWGYRTVRGSTTRGAGRVLLAFVRELRAGAVGMLTPDGPKGPAGVPQAGVLLAARQGDALIVPVRCVVSRAWRLRSWDRFLIPQPFARVTIRYAEPFLPATTDQVALDELARRMGAP